MGAGFVGLGTDNLGNFTDLRDLMYLRGGSKVTISSSVFCVRSKDIDIESQTEELTCMPRLKAFHFY
jgi:hypothetical protein